MLERLKEQCHYKRWIWWLCNVFFFVFNTISVRICGREGVKEPKSRTRAQEVMKKKKVHLPNLVCRSKSNTNLAQVTKLDLGRSVTRAGEDDGRTISKGNSWDRKYIFKRMLTDKLSALLMGKAKQSFNERKLKKQVTQNRNKPQINQGKSVWHSAHAGIIWALCL